LIVERARTLAQACHGFGAFETPDAAEPNQVRLIKGLKREEN
jgi:hypothetical protein